MHANNPRGKGIPPNRAQLHKGDLPMLSAKRRKPFYLVTQRITDTEKLPREDYGVDCENAGEAYGQLQNLSRLSSPSRRRKSLHRHPSHRRPQQPDPHHPPTAGCCCVSGANEGAKREMAVCRKPASTQHQHTAKPQSRGFPRLKCLISDESRI